MKWIQLMGSLLAREKTNRKRRKQPRTRSSNAARQATSQRDVLQRRRAQRRRQLVQQWQRLVAGTAGLRQWLPEMDVWSVRPSIPGFSGWRPSKLLSATLLLGVLAAIYMLQQNEAFFVYRENVHFSGQQYLSREELYEYTDVESWSVLWIEPMLIRSQILEHPYVADAGVEVSWPARVTVKIDEVDPVAIWATQQGDYWLLKDGTALKARPTEQLAPSIRLVDPEAAARAPTVSNQLRVEPRLIRTAESLAASLPGLNEFWYNNSTRLNFSIPGSQTWVNWGDAGRFDEKWVALQTVLPEIQSTPDRQRVYTVSAPNRPYFQSFAGATTR